jgi:hypothetical protein
MKNKTIIKFVNSLIILPIVSLSGPTGIANIPMGMENIANKAEIVFLERGSGDQLAEDVKLAEEILRAKAEAIDSYFKSKNMPLAGYGKKMVLEAEKNGLDWRLLPAISVRESTGGRHKCKKASFSSFGWGSCKINFDSHDEEIEVVAKNLGGNNPKTERHYEGKTIKGILQAYNPPAIVPKYADQVMKIMGDIGPEKIHIETHSLAKGA